MNLPDFLIIGAIRCGTTGFYETLIQHPSIYEPIKKELKFFNRDKDYEKGISYYSRHFNKCQNSQICGESTPQYFHHEKVTKRIYKHLPNTKIIILMRNPINRLYSFYYLYKRTCEKRKIKAVVPFNKFLKKKWIPKTKKHTDAGDYIYHLKRWNEYYPLKDMHIVKSEDFFTNPQETINKTYEFLNLRNFEIKPINPNKSKFKEERKQKDIKYLKEYYEPLNQQLYKYIKRDIKW